MGGRSTANRRVRTYIVFRYRSCPSSSRRRMRISSSLVSNVPWLGMQAMVRFSFPLGSMYPSSNVCAVPWLYRKFPYPLALQNRGRAQGRTRSGPSDGPSRHLPRRNLCVIPLQTSPPFPDFSNSELSYGLGTGEHGVGVGKKEHLYEELGAGTVELMKTIKRTIDPLGLFNPGKVR